MSYTATQFSTAEDKQKFENQFKKFVSNGFRKSHFPKWFYERLSMCFGNIAHYNQSGFYSTYFEDSEGFTQFIDNCVDYGCYGDPAYTYSDVEKVLKSWLIEKMGS